MLFIFTYNSVSILIYYSISVKIPYMSMKFQSHFWQVVWSIIFLFLSIIVYFLSEFCERSHIVISKFSILFSEHIYVRVFLSYNIRMYHFVIYRNLNVNWIFIHVYLILLIIFAYNTSYTYLFKYTLWEILMEKFLKHFMFDMQ